ncbi:hypothetical protein [Holospora curviuscula]|uniref:Leucine Rich repeats (2 copies) n=1 Tax=Holospora curviuscula TaxID=1082868 RepID=A0A2S5R9L0_9PROT|nr:hypothetical protein [Holospora curviuscula]PPE03987.1 hypothetical protein HCUR_00522 [Holospora curviuscula]
MKKIKSLLFFLALLTSNTVILATSSLEGQQEQDELPDDDSGVMLAMAAFEGQQEPVELPYESVLQSYLAPHNRRSVFQSLKFSPNTIDAMLQIEPHLTDKLLGSELTQQIRASRHLPTAAFVKLLTLFHPPIFTIERLFILPNANAQIVQFLQRPQQWIQTILNLKLPCPELENDQYPSPAQIQELQQLPNTAVLSSEQAQRFVKHFYPRIYKILRFNTEQSTNFMQLSYPRRQQLLEYSPNTIDNILRIEPYHIQLLTDGQFEDLLHINPDHFKKFRHLSSSQVYKLRGLEVQKVDKVLNFELEQIQQILELELGQIKRIIELDPDEVTRVLGFTLPHRQRILMAEAPGIKKFLQFDDAECGFFLDGPPQWFYMVQELLVENSYFFRLKTLGMNYWERLFDFTPYKVTALLNIFDNNTRRQILELNTFKPILKILSYDAFKNFLSCKPQERETLTQFRNFLTDKFPQKEMLTEFISSQIETILNLESSSRGKILTLMLEEIEKFCDLVPEHREVIARENMSESIQKILKFRDFEEIKPFSIDKFNNLLYLTPEEIETLNQLTSLQSAEILNLKSYYERKILTLMPEEIGKFLQFLPNHRTALLKVENFSESIQKILQFCDLEEIKSFSDHQFYNLLKRTPEEIKKLNHLTCIEREEILNLESYQQSKILTLMPEEIKKFYDLVPEHRALFVKLPRENMSEKIQKILKFRDFKEITPFSIDKFNNLLNCTLAEINTLNQLTSLQSAEILNLHSYYQSKILTLMPEEIRKFLQFLPNHREALLRVENMSESIQKILQFCDLEEIKSFSDHQFNNLLKRTPEEMKTLSRLTCIEREEILNFQFDNDTKKMLTLMLEEIKKFCDLVPEHRALLVKLPRENMSEKIQKILKFRDFKEIKPFSIDKFNNLLYLTPEEIETLNQLTSLQSAEILNLNSYYERKILTLMPEEIRKFLQFLPNHRTALLRVENFSESIQKILQFCDLEEIKSFSDHQFYNLLKRTPEEMKTLNRLTCIEREKILNFQLYDDTEKLLTLMLEEIKKFCDLVPEHREVLLKLARENMSESIQKILKFRDFKEITPFSMDKFNNLLNCTLEEINTLNQLTSLQSAEILNLDSYYESEILTLMPEEIGERLNILSKQRKQVLCNAEELKQQMTTAVPQDQQCSVTSSKKDPSKAQFEE